MTHVQPFGLCLSFPVRFWAGQGEREHTTSPTPGFPGGNWPRRRPGRWRWNSCCCKEPKGVAGRAGDDAPGKQTGMRKG